MKEPIYKFIDINEIVANEKQPRTHFEREKIQELSKKYLDNEAIIEKDLSGRDRFAFIKNF